MADKLKPLSSTVRVVEWDELPASVREVPDNFNPLAEGVLMRHQREWLAIKADIKVAEKGRRTGITFAEGQDAPLTASARRSAGGDNVYYIGDTKDKGLEFIGYAAKFARVIAAAQGQGISDIEEFLFADQDEAGNSKYITSYRIRFASGYQIVALSSNPANIRGLQGKVIIDEAAYHRNVQAVIDAATALLIWGGSIVIISTHNGKGNPFNTLCRDIRDGRYGARAVVYRVTFDDAVANGLYERRQMMRGEPATAEDKERWYKGIRAAYGPRRAQMREELDAIPRDGNGVCIPGVWVDEAMSHDGPVLRLALGEDFVNQSVARRDAYVEDWIERYVQPELAKLDKLHRHAVGMDFARHRNFTEIVPLGVRSDLRRKVPFVVELHNVPSRQQELVVNAVIEGVPRFCGAAFDATGSGETLAEDTADRYGRDAVAQIKLTRNWYGLWMPRVVDLFGDGMIDMPRDDNLGQDMREVQMVDGIPMVPPVERKDLKDPDLMRHGDYAIALCLANHAAVAINQGEIAYTAAPKHAPADSDNPYGRFSPGAW